MGDQKSIEPHWIVGFKEEYEPLEVKIANREAHKYQVTLRFRFTHHIRDQQILSMIAKYLGCGKVYIRSNNLACDKVLSDFY